MASAAMLPNGHVLFDAGATPTTAVPTHFFEFDPTDNSLTDVTPTTPDLSSIAVVRRRGMLVLPSGQVLSTSPLRCGQRPALRLHAGRLAASGLAADDHAACAANGDGTYTLTGTQLNGLSAGASYGSPAEMDSNYPIVELQATDGSGQVYFARTFNWSSTGVATGSTPVTTEFSLPAGLPLAPIH